ncbi:MAG: formylglycine-generating enzyme family protein [Deinococcus sp.]|nr:formylglycine-generating enzyme family protein [Deinococcus sp.]
MPRFYRFWTLMLVLLLLAFEPAGQSQPAEGTPPAEGVKADLTFADGEVFPGTFLTLEIQMQTTYAGTITIPSRLLRRLQVGEPARAELLNGDRISGTLLTTPVTFMTRFGTLDINTPEVREVVTRLSVVRREERSFVVRLRSGDVVSGRLLPAVENILLFETPFGGVGIQPEFIQRIAPDERGALVFTTTEGGRVVSAAQFPNLGIATAYGEYQLSGSEVANLVRSGLPQATLDLSVDEPEAAVFVDGSRVETLQGGVMVEAGSHVLEARTEGGASEVQVVSISAGERRAVRLVLQPLLSAVAGGQPVTLPLVLTGASSWRYDIQPDGSLSDGTSNAYDGAFILTISGTSFGASSRALAAPGGREIFLGPVSIAGLNVTRRIYVPEDQGFVRYLEVLDNPGTSPRTVTVVVSGDLGSGGSTTVVATGDGDRAFEVVDDFLVTDDNSDGGGTPTLVFVPSNSGSRRPTTVDLSGDRFRYEWSGITIPAGAEAALMHFAAQQPNRAQAQALARTFTNPTGLMLVNLGQARANILNFSLIGTAAVGPEVSPPSVPPGSPSIVINGVDFVLVPAGSFTMGSDSGGSDERPVHTVTLQDYYIMRTEVTVAQYERFVQATGRRRPSYRNSGADFPATDVDWNDAAAFCAWLGQGTGFGTRLPTEAEWEKAARGTDGRVYPWVNSFDASRLNSSGSQDGFGDIAPVGQFPSGASPYGALDMAGNVWEWTSSLYQAYPYSATDGRENPSASGNRVFRGGSFNFVASFVRSAVRAPFDPTGRGSNVGFRCVAQD